MSFLRSFRSVATPALKRSYAAHAAAPVNPNVNRSALKQVLPAKTPAALHLKSGQTFHGQAFGHPESRFGETVFTTSITSCTFLSPLQAYPQRSMKHRARVNKANQ